MAIFEQQSFRKVVLDDTEPLSCVIESWRNVNGHTEFVIKVQRGPFSNKTWHIYKRYNDFHKLYMLLHSSGINLQFPPKRLIGNSNPEFINQRQQGLQKFLNDILMNPILVSSLPARSFVDPANYCQPFGELALQHVSLALRGEVGWEVIGPLAEIGWRLRKHYYQIRCKAHPKEEMLGGWTDYGPDKYLDDKDLHAVFKSLGQIQHPFIHSIEMCLCTDIGGLVVRSCHKDGSLRDILYCTKPKQAFLKKYGSPKGHKPLELHLVALYGRQILEALKFLHDKGIPYGHLHTGNVIIADNDRVKLLDIENGVLGVPSFYRPYFMQHRKINTLEAVDVYCFGHTLYEMAFGAPLQESVAEDLNNCPIVLKSVLESILSPEACKASLPTIESLLNHQFFLSVKLNLNTNEKIHLKFPSVVKEHLKHIMMKMEERLKEEQKMARSQKRLVRVQEMMSSEEEKKKQRHKLRHEQKLIAKEQQQQKNKTKEKELLNEKANGVSPESISSSTATSVGTVTPPSISGSSVPSPPPPPPLPPPQAMGQKANGTPTPEINKDRAALLGAICNFNKTSLRKTKVN